MNTQTAKPSQTAEQAQPAQPLAVAGTGKAVARIAPARLPYHPAIEGTFGVDRSQWRALTDSIFPMAKTTEAVILALSYCKARHLDIMKKPVHIVPMWNSELKKEVETVWPAITEHRITAHRTGQYAGTDATLFGEQKTKHFEAKVQSGKNAGKIYKADVTFPEWAQVTVYRLVAGQRCAFPGPRVYFEEFFGMTAGLPVPNSRWARSPSQMLEKCAEAGALRKAFTEEIGADPIAEEMEGRIIDQVLSQMKKARPNQPLNTSAHFVPENEVVDSSAEAAAEDGEAAEEGHDPETGEVVEEGSAATAEAAKPDRGADWLAARIASIAGVTDRALLAQKDKAVREVIANEERPDLLPKWEEALKAALDALPAETVKAAEAPKGETKALSAADQEYEDWKADQYALLKNAKLTRTVDDLQELTVKELREADRPAYVEACNAKAKELLSGKK